MKYIRILIISLSLISLFGFASVSADSSAPSLPSVKTISSFVGDACSGLSNISSSGCTEGSDTIKNVAKTVVDILSFVIGIISVIMILIAGFKYITSSGDTNAVASAKNTLIYAIVGVFIAVLAQILVHAVLESSNNIANNSYLPNHSLIDKDG